MSVSKIVERLGGETALGCAVRTELELVSAVEAGFPAAVRDALVHSAGLSAGEIGARAGGRRPDRLSRADSDRLVRLARVVVLADEVFGDPVKAHRWLRKPNRGLCGRIPLDLLRTGVGARAVEDVLQRIPHGVFA
jgi:putative toxin-antitoxin system antitoxin component (TIGR02293 family)